MSTNPRRHPESRQKRPGKTIQVGFRLPAWLVEMIDEWVTPHVATRYGRKVSRTDVITYLLVMGVGPQFIEEVLADRSAQAIRDLGSTTGGIENRPEIGLGSDDSRSRAIEVLRTVEVALAWLKELDPKWGSEHYAKHLENKKKLYQEEGP